MKRILAISLLFVFLSGQFNLTWATHFCGKFAVKNAMTFGKADLSCGMEEVDCCSEDATSIDGPVILSEECCSNDFYSADSSTFFNKTESSFDDKVIFAASYVIALFELTQKNNNLRFFVAASPPLIQPDRQVFYQTFLL